MIARPVVCLNTNPNISKFTKVAGLITGLNSEPTEEQKHADVSVVLFDRDTSRQTRDSALCFQDLEAAEEFLNDPVNEASVQVVCFPA